MAPVVTAVISDLHLGTRSRADVLRRPELRAILFEGLQEADEIVLLGDVVELRELPLPEALEAAFPFFEELGEALPGRRITVLAGNHDHHVELAAHGLGVLGLIPLVPGWKNRKDAMLVSRTAPASSRPLALIAERMPGNEIELAYPGVWLRPRTYATHGHYLDAHMTIPRLEAIAVSATARATGGLPRGRRTPGDYEATLTPLYAFAYALAQGSARARAVLGMDLSRKVWRRIDRRRDIGSRALTSVGIPAAVWALNRAGIGPFEAKLSGETLRRSGIRAMGEVVAALELDADEVVFGHTHRPGPLPGERDWDARLFNTGSWLYEPNLLAENAANSPYWPGCALFIRDDQPPELRRLLAGVTHAELSSAPAYS